MSENKTIILSRSTTLHVTLSGTAAKRPSLILLHFWGGSSLTYSQLISYLSLYLHCIAVDFPGWGSSTGPQDPGAYSISNLATDIETVITKLHIQDFILVGHSMGGKVAQLIAGRGLVKGLKGVVLIAPAPPTSLELPEEMREQQLAAYSTYQSAELVTKSILSSSKLSDEVVSLIVDDMMKGNKFAKAAWPAYGMGEDIRREARMIDAPVLVIAGELDRVETVERLKGEVLANVRGAKMVVLEGRGHMLPIEAAREVAGLVREFVGSL